MQTAASDNGAAENNENEWVNEWDSGGRTDGNVYHFDVELSCWIRFRWRLSVNWVKLHTPSRVDFEEWIMLSGNRWLLSIEVNCIALCFEWNWVSSIVINWVELNWIVLNLVELWIIYCRWNWVISITMNWVKLLCVQLNWSERVKLFCLVLSKSALL